jgi:hypothetical protein
LGRRGFCITFFAGTAAQQQGYVYNEVNGYFYSFHEPGIKMSNMPLFSALAVRLPICNIEGRCSTSLYPRPGITDYGSD